ncbi:glycoside hydrolase family 36 protein [Deinococcus roseus]|uniref:Alpha-galactosidase n=1 Tax=Deinococcus roseus TaxID=392414 RepID=A0ABQ2CY87_9DEIO|nr:glycoside hydrolase family 36 protein [Deinococcus roseus]GGJ32290.1 alpha-galactosidase [Deinococcus roseus]
MQDRLTTQTHTWILPAQPYQILLNGYQSWSDADLRDLSDVQQRPILDELVKQGYDIQFPPSGEKGIWRSHHLIALITESGAYVGFALSAKTSVSCWEARIEAEKVTVTLLTDGPPEEVVFEWTDAPIERIEELSRQFAHNMQAPQWKPVRVWCSWYSYYRNITEHDFLENARLARELSLPFDCFQLDDGYQNDLGDWLEKRPSFQGDVARIPAQIEALGFKAGLWIAPFIASPTSQLFRDHPDWFLKDEKGQPVVAGDNWDNDYYALDLSQQEVLDWLEELACTFKSHGYTYFKLDFLFAGALPGVRRGGLSRTEAYRKGLEAFKRGAGDAFILGCGAPLAQSVGLVDAMRIGPDVAPVWDDGSRRRWVKDGSHPSLKGTLQTCLSRFYQYHWYMPDPDVMIARQKLSLLSDMEREALLRLLQVCGGLLASSDPLMLLEKQDLDVLRTSLDFQPRDLPRTLQERFGVAPTHYHTVTFNLTEDLQDGIFPHGSRVERVLERV